MLTNGLGRIGGVPAAVPQSRVCYLLDLIHLNVTYKGLGSMKTDEKSLFKVFAPSPTIGWWQLSGRYGRRIGRWL